MSADSVSTSMILPLPSSPHWAPTRIVFAINFSGARLCEPQHFQTSNELRLTEPRSAFSIKIPGRKSGAKRRGLCGKKLENSGGKVNPANGARLCAKRQPQHLEFKMTCMRSGHVTLGKGATV